MASQDPTNTPSSSGKHDEPTKPSPPKDSKKKDDKKDEDLSDEDLALKQQLELFVERVQDSDPGLQKVALESMSVPYDRAAIKFKGVEADINFDMEDYEDYDMEY